MDTKEYLVKTETHRFLGGEHLVYEFPNGYGASVIPVKDYETNGVVEHLREVAVTLDGEITYETPVTDDVVRVDVTELDALLERIATL